MPDKEYINPHDHMNGLIVPFKVAKLKTITAEAKIVFAFVASKDDACDVAEIAEAVGLCADYVEDALDELQQVGLASPRSWKAKSQ